MGRLRLGRVGRVGRVSGVDGGWARGWGRGGDEGQQLRSEGAAGVGQVGNEALHVRQRLPGHVVGL